MKVAINGFGRIGRLVLIAGLEKGINFIHLNSPADNKTLAHLLKYDSVHGKFKGKIKVLSDSININGKKLNITHEKDINKLKWNADVVIESTGIFLKKEHAEIHMRNGAEKVLFTAPSKSEDIKTIVMGVNDRQAKKSDKILSVASCTTNCFAPMAKIINDAYGIKRGYMLTAHAYTTDQRILDGSHKDLRRARAAPMNIVPTTSGASKAVGKVIPQLSGKLHSMAVRVPVPDGSMTYFVSELKKQVTPEKVNVLFRKLSKTAMKGIIEYSDEPLVSSDIIGNPHSCIFDSLLTEEDNDMMKTVGWYDNEWGYSNRVVDILKLM